MITEIVNVDDVVRTVDAESYRYSDNDNSTHEIRYETSRYIKFLLDNIKLS